MFLAKNYRWLLPLVFVLVLIIANENRIETINTQTFSSNVETHWMYDHWTGITWADTFSYEDGFFFYSSLTEGSSRTFEEVKLLFKWIKIAWYIALTGGVIWLICGVFFHIKYYNKND